MRKNDIKIPKNTLEAIIENYTRESGVRELEKKIGKILRKSARQYATDGYFAKTEIKPTDLYDFLEHRNIHATSIREMITQV